MIEMLSKMMRRVRERGLRSTGGWALHRLHEELSELRLGIATKGYITSAELNHTGSSNAYEPTRYAWLRKVLREMDVASGSEELLEYGAGKGRVAAVCARLPFRRIIGIELSPDLSAIARKNVACIKGRRCADVEILTRDATDYHPPASTTRVFLFNPFHPPVIDAVGRRLHESVLESPRHLRVIFLYSSVDGNYLDSWEWLGAGRAVSLGQGHPIRMMVYDYFPDSGEQVERDAERRRAHSGA